MSKSLRTLRSTSIRPESRDAVSLLSGRKRRRRAVLRELRRAARSFVPGLRRAGQRRQKFLPLVRRRADDGVRATGAALKSYTPRHLAERILTSRAALEGERKQVTVLFADLKGSMELLADRDPEEARKLLDPVLERMMEAVHHYEGTVNQVMGDGIMALFGAPLAHEDHAVRACYAALRMQEAIGRYADEVRRRTASRCRSASGSTRARSSSARSAAICAWTTRRSARRPTWRRAWSSSATPGTDPAHRRLRSQLAEGYITGQAARPGTGEGSRASPSRSTS